MLLPLPETTSPAPFRPWATYGLLALCVLIFVPVQVAHHANLRHGLHRLEQAVAYHAEHPYLRLDSRLDKLLGRTAGSTAAPPGAQGAGTPGKGADFRYLEQAELDGLTRGGLDTLGRLPYARWGVVPARLSILGLVGHLFLHANWLPLLGNLLVVWLAGSYLEARWSAPLLLGCFLLSGLLGAVAFVLRYPGFPTPLIGASAAAAGVIGAFAVTFSKEKISLGYGWNPFPRETLRLPALLLLGVWLLREGLALVSPDVLVPTGGAAAVVYWNHLPGFAAGALAAMALRTETLAARMGVTVPRAPLVRPPSAGTQALAFAREARGQSRGDAAWQALRAAAQAEPGNAQVVDALWEMAVECGREEEAAAAVVRLVKQLACPNTAAEAYRRWCRLLERAPDTPVPLATDLRLAQALRGVGQDREAEQVLGAAAARVEPRERPDTLAQLAQTLRGGEQQRIARLALAHPGLSPAHRLALQSLLDAPTPASADTAGDLAAPKPKVTTPARRAGATSAAAVQPLLITYAVPLGIRNGHLGLDLEGAGRRVVPLSRIRGLAGAQVYDGGVEPEYLLDLVLDFPAHREQPASVIRLHSGRFDPRRLVPTEPEVGDALLSLSGQLLVGGGGRWLLGAHPTELRSYDSPAAHQKELLAALRLNTPAAETDQPT